MTFLNYDRFVTCTGKVISDAFSLVASFLLVNKTIKVFLRASAMPCLPSNQEAAGFHTSECEVSRVAVIVKGMVTVLSAVRRSLFWTI
jgi:hypothetical protein